MGKHIKMIKQKYKETKKRSLLVYLILRFLVIVCMILQIVRGDWNNAILCFLSLILFTVPTFIEDKFKITLPTVLESIIYIFIFSAEILGEINNFYQIIPNWDTILHTLNGFLAAGVGFSLVELLNINSKGLNLSPLYVAIVAFCFSMTIGVLWEFFEYGADTYFKFDMQKDKIVTTISSVELNPERLNDPVVLENIKSSQINSESGITTVKDGYLDIGIHDTMEDLFVNFIGAICFSLIGFLYIKNKEKYKFARNFIPIKEEEKIM